AIVGAAIVGLLATTFFVPLQAGIAIQLDGDPATANFGELLAGIAFWTAVTLVASALPVRVSDGVQVAVSTAPLMAAAVLGGPAITAPAAHHGNNCYAGG